MRSQTPLSGKQAATPEPAIRAPEISPRSRLNGARWIIVCVIACSTLLTSAQSAQASVARTLPPPQNILLFALPASPKPVGTQIRWIALAADRNPLVYRFSVAASVSGPYTILRDYSMSDNFLWTPLQEGQYYIMVTIKEGYSGTTTVDKVASYTVTSRVTGSQAVVTRTANPQVALYSAPACPTGRVITVAFRAVSSASWTTTNVQPCQASLSRNFFVAGMLARTLYELVNVVLGAGQAITSTPLYFLTGAPPRVLRFPTFSVPQPPTSQSDTAANLIFHEIVLPSIDEVNPLATNLQGQVTWYTYQSDLPNDYGLRIQQVGGTQGSVVILAGAPSLQAADYNVLRILDLAGDPLQETNVAQINQQLQARGQEIIYNFSHDARILPNGDIAVLGVTQKTITTTAVMGDMLLVLDKNLQVVWTWDAFDHLDPFRGPTLGDICSDSYPVCPAPAGPNTIDWTHANSIDYSPSDGDFIVSLRDQDWVIKINYDNGSGDGSVLWRLGPQGDFTLVPLNPRDPYPWFSHQHDANFVDGATMAVFDNGNTRCATVAGPCDSRGQTYIVDQQTRVVTQTVNADLGNYSNALGTAQRLSNGNFNFTSGVQTFPPPPFAQEIEVLPTGAKAYVQQINTIEYRAWRLPSLYSPTNPPCSVCAMARAG